MNPFNIYAQQLGSRISRLTSSLLFDPLYYS